MSGESKDGEWMHHELFRIRKMIANSDKTNVYHLEHSKEKYGDGSEYKGYDSWIDYWEKESGKKLGTMVKCPCCGEEMPVTDIVGSHVIDEDKKIYVTPTCDKCNSRAINDKEFRNHKFSVRKDHLVLFDYSSLKKLRISKEK